MASLDPDANQDDALAVGVGGVPAEGDDETGDLNWRGDPAKTFSDWTIEIVTKSDAPRDGSNDEASEPWEVVTNSFHVHKFILSCGSRRSEYFARLFHCKNFRESESSTSRIELDPLAAAAFPYLLDFVYQRSCALTINTSTATALHWMGNYFEMPRLRLDALQFCKNDMNLESFSTYYQHSMIFADDVIHGMVADFLGKNIKELPTKSDIVEFSEPKLLQEIAQSVDIQDERASRNLSILVCRFCMHHSSTLDSITFQNLTKSDVLPRVSVNTAMKLCELEDELYQRKSDSSLCDGTVGVKSDLQERCASAMSEDIDRLQARFSHEKSLQRLQQRQPHFLVDLLVKSLSKANKDLEETKAALNKKTDLLERFRPIPVSEMQYSRCTTGAVDVPQELCEANPNLTNQQCSSYTTHPLMFGGSIVGMVHPIFYYKQA